MSWKRSLKVGDLDDGQKLEMTCVRCCHVHYLTPVMVMASPEREFLNLDEFRRSAGRAQCQQTRDERWPSTVIRRVTA